MKYIEKYLTKFNLSILVVGMLAAAIIILISIGSVWGALNDSGNSDIDDIISIFSSAASSMQLAFYLFILLLIASIILAAGSGVRFGYKKEMEPCYVVYFVAGVVVIYTSIRAISFISNIKSIGSAENFFDLAANAAELVDGAVPLYNLVRVALIGLILVGIYAGYCIYKIKTSTYVYDELFADEPDTEDNLPAFDGSVKKVEQAVAGLDLGSSVEKAKEAGAAFEEKTKEASQALSAKIKGMSKKQKMGIIGAIAAVVIFFGGIKIYDTFFNFDQINLMEGMIQPTFYGYDGEGYLEDEPSLGDIDYDMTKEGMEDFLEDVTYTVDKTEGLSNGDEVTITAVYSEETAKALKVKVTENTMTVKVEGLIERFADGNSIPEEDVKLVSKAMDQYAEEIVETDADYYFDGEDVTCKRLGMLFAREKEKNEGDSGYYDQIIAVYQVMGIDENKFFLVSLCSSQIEDGVNSETDFGAVEGRLFTTEYMDHFMEELKYMVDADGYFILTPIGVPDEECTTLEQWYNHSLAETAKVIYPAVTYPSDRPAYWEVIVDKNEVTYEYKYAAAYTGEALEYIEEHLVELMEEEGDSYSEALVGFEEESGIKGLAVKVRFVDNKGKILYTKKFTK